LAKKIGLEEDEEEEVDVEEGVEAEETKILLDFLFFMKIQPSQ